MRKSGSFIAFMTGAIVLGVAAGLVLGTNARILGDIGFLLIQFIKILAAPLIFFAIIDSFMRTRIPARKGMQLLGLSSVNALMALAIATVLAYVLPVGSHIDFTAVKQSLGHSVASSAAHVQGPAFSVNELLPKSVLEPFLNNSVIGVVITALILGMALRRIKSRTPELEGLDGFQSFVSVLLHALGVILEVAVKLLPLSIFGIIAKAVGSGGLEVLAVLAVFAAIVALGLFLHAVVYYSLLLKFFGGISPVRFFKAASPALLTAFSAASSLATLPVTLKTLEKRMGVSTESARLAACVGTNLNHDGIILYEVAAAFFVAQIYGISLSIPQHFLVAGTSVIAAIGIAGIPEAGLITLSLVLTSVGLPLEAVPFLLPLDWLLGRLRATTNVTSDMVVANLLDVRKSA